jgi:tetratricopeptide (TPR) repeat protein
MFRPRCHLRLSHLLPIACATTVAIAAQAQASADVLKQDTAGQQAKHYIFEGRTISEQERQALEMFNSATMDIQMNRWEQANQKLIEVLQVAPNLYQAHSNYAIVLARLGKLEQAKTEADTAARLGPDKPEPLVAKAAVDQELGKLDEAAAQYEAFVQKFPNHPLAAYVRPMIPQLRSEAKKESAVSSAMKPGDKNADDYFEYATYDAVAKFLPNRFPLKIFIPTDAQAGAVPGYAPEFGSILHAAFDDWSKASGGVLRFGFVDDRADADIECSWTSDPKKVRQPAEGGEAHVVYDPINGIRHVSVVLLTRHPETGLANSANLMKEVCLHEIGHSLGLIDHSPNPDDVMFCSMPADDREHALSKRDANTLIHLYRPDVKLADRYHGGEDPNDKAALNNAGIKLAASGEFRQAADKFEAALKIDPNLESAKRNLSACLNNIAIDAAQNGNLPEALRSLKRALELEGDHGDAKKRASILTNLAIVYQKMGKTADAASARAAAAQAH